MKTYWWPSKNFGDTLTPVILKHFIDEEIEQVSRDASGKFLAVGSILHALKENDVVWGTGLQVRKKLKVPNGVKILALRGPVTRDYLDGENITKVFGDPALLLPLIYNPKIEKTHKEGLIPHYVDKNLVRPQKGQKVIDILSDWKTVINEVLSCEKIISSSLHGIICAEAYGIPAQWAVYSNKIKGGEMKYQDYFLGTGRGYQKTFTNIPKVCIINTIQKRLIDALKQWKS